MKKSIQTFALIIAAPFILLGAVFEFARDAFVVGTRVGEALINYLSE